VGLLWSINGDEPRFGWLGVAVSDSQRQGGFGHYEIRRLPVCRVPLFCTVPE